MKFKWATVAELGRVVTGKTPPTKQREFFDGDYPFITPTDLEYDSYYVSRTETTVTGSAKAKFRNQFIPAGAITYTCIASVGKIGIAERESLTNQQINSVVPNDEHDGKFLYYLLRNETARIQGRCTGVATPIINKTDFEKVEVQVPIELHVEQAIGSILSAYDDLIENNRRRMVLLEDAARQLYREWFVRLRFPGHEHSKIIDGVPEGWEKCTAYSAMEVLSGGTPKTSEPDYWEGEIPFYTPKDASISAYVLDTERCITELGLKNCNSRLYETNTVFISARGTVGKLNLASRPMAMSQSCYALVGRGHISQLFMYCALREAIEHFKQHAVGAVFDAIVVDTFRLIPFSAPDEKVVRLFEESVTPVFRQVANLMEQVKKLRDARDLLLPKLMSGQIAV